MFVHYKILYFSAVIIPVVRNTLFLSLLLFYFFRICEQSVKREADTKSIINRELIQKNSYNVLNSKQPTYFSGKRDLSFIDKK